MLGHPRRRQSESARSGGSTGRPSATPSGPVDAGRALSRRRRAAEEARETPRYPRPRATAPRKEARAGGPAVGTPDRHESFESHVHQTTPAGRRASAVIVPGDRAASARARRPTTPRSPSSRGSRRVAAAWRAGPSRAGKHLQKRRLPNPASGHPRRTVDRAPRVWRHNPRGPPRTLAGSGPAALWRAAGWRSGTRTSHEAYGSV